MRNFSKYTIFFLLATILLIACRKEIREPLVTKESLFYMSVKVNSLGNTNPQDEDAIYRIRTIVTGMNGLVVSNQLHTTDSPSDANHTVAVKTNFGSGYTIYTICNETNELSGRLGNITTEGALKNLQFSALDIKCPLVMFGKQDGLTIQINPITKTTEVLKNDVLWADPTIDVSRTMVKLSFTAIKNSPADDLFSIEQMSYSVYQVPKYGLLENKNNEYYNLLNGWETIKDIACTGTLSLDKNDAKYEIDKDQVMVVGESITSPDIYIPEHLIDPDHAEDSDYCTYLLINAKCKRGVNSPVFNINYRINLGANPPIDHNLKRNYNYRIYATITGTNTMGFHAEIIPMTEYNVPINWNPFEGYVIAGENEEDGGMDITNNFSRYSGILKISKGGAYHDALFRYGSIVALTSGSAATNFDASKDVLWKPDAVESSITTWSSVNYLSGATDIDDAAHSIGNIKQGKGDPCRLVGLTNSEIVSGTHDNKQWRMATDKEMQDLNIARNDTRKPTGFYSYNYLVTPYTGYREGSLGKMVVKKSNGYYWSSTANKAFVFDNINGKEGTLLTDNAEKAYAIRCVRTDVPPSRISAIDAYTDYNGGTDIKVEMAEFFIVPFWKIALKNESDKNYVTFSKDQGTYNESAFCTVKPSATPYDRIYYPATLTGYGLDGVVHTKDVTIHQMPLKHTITLEISSDVPLTERNGYIRVPQKGATLTIRIAISPEPQEPYKSTFASQRWHATLKYYNYQENKDVGTTVTTQDPSVLVIPENSWNNSVTLNISMVPEDIPNFPPYTINSLIYLQDYTK